MQTEKHEDITAVLGYFIFLLLVVGVSLFINVNLYDLVYLVVVLCCILKCLIILKK